MGTLVFTPGDMLVRHNKVHTEVNDSQRQTDKSIGRPAEPETLRLQINENHGQHNTGGESQDEAEDPCWAGLPQR